MDLDNLKNLRTDMEKCFRCSLCKMVPLPTVTKPEFTEACPASRLYHFHGYSGSGKQIMALSLLDGRIEADEAMAKIVFACTTCGYCDVACKFIMDAERQKVNMALREHLVDQGHAPAPLKQMIANLKEHGHARGENERTRGAWAEGLGLKVLPKEKADTLLFAGCATAASERAGEVARKLAKLLLHAGVDVGILGDDEPCCALPAYWTGHRKVFSELANDNVKLFDRLGVKRVIVVSGSCLGVIRSKYPDYASKPGVEIVHATEAIAELIEDGSLKLNQPVHQKVTYHDPCYLGRQSEPTPEWKGEEKIALGVMTYTEPPRPVNFGTNGVFEAPREILGAVPGLDFIEMQRVREYAYCCGGGGGAPEAYPELARTAAEHRLEEARSTGAETLVTACASCMGQLAGAQNGQDEAVARMRVVDVIDLAFEAAGLKE